MSRRTLFSPAAAFVLMASMGPLAARSPAAGVGGSNAMVAAVDAAAAATAEDRALLQWVSTLPADPPQLLTLWFDREGKLSAAVSDLRTDYYRELTRKRQEATDELNAKHLAPVLAVLTEDQQALVRKVRQAGDEYERNNRAATEALEGVTREVTGKTGNVHSSRNLECVLLVPGLTEEETRLVQARLMEFRQQLHADAEARMKEKGGRPDWKNREAWQKWIAERASVRARLERERFGEQADALARLVSAGKAEKFRRLVKASDDWAAQTTDSRKKLAANLEAAVGRDAIVRAVTRGYRGLGAALTAPKIDKDTELWSYVYVPQDPFSLAERWVELSDGQTRRVQALRSEWSAIQTRRHAEAAAWVNAAYADRFAGLLPEDRRAAFRRVCDTVQRHTAAFLDAGEPFLAKARELGFAASSCPTRRSHIFYQIRNALPEDVRKRVTDLLQDAAREHAPAIEAELKRRGMDAKSADYTQVHAEVSASIAEQAEERLKDRIAESLPPDAAKHFRTLAAVWDEVDAGRKALTRDTLEKLRPLGVAQLLPRRQGKNGR